MKPKSSKHKIAKHFNRAFDTYDLYCHVQWYVGYTLIHHLINIPVQSLSLIDIGCGSGLVTQELLSLNPQTLVVLDLAEQLLLKAKMRLKDHIPIIINADFDSMPFQHHSFDLAFSNMSLQWSLNISKTIQEISRILKFKGYFIFTLPIQGTFHELKPYFPLNHFHTKADVEEALLTNNFRLLQTQLLLVHVYYSNILNALQSLKKTGVTYNVNQHINSLKGNPFIKILTKQSLSYIKPFSLTYYIYLGVAQKIL